MGFNFLSWLSGYVIGIIVAIIIFRPTKAFDEGYEAAMESCNDPNKWFNEGWKAAEKFYKNRLFETALEMHRHQELMEEPEKKGEEDDQT